MGARVNDEGVVLDPDGILICSASSDQLRPAVIFDGANYVIIWEDKRNYPDIDIYGAVVSTTGVVIDSFLLTTQSGLQLCPAIAHGPGPQMLATYKGWTGYINDHPANAMRSWAQFCPYVGITENIESPIYGTRYGLIVSPNPFIHITEIRYAMLSPRYLITEINQTISASAGRQSKQQKLEINIYDVAGRLVNSFDLGSAFDNQELAISWDGTDSSSRRLPSGIYFARLVAGIHSTTERILLVR